MSQLNINLTSDFEIELKAYMEKRGLRQKSKAIRQAIHEALEADRKQRPKTDFDSWCGLALQGPENPSPRFQNEDDLWEKKG